MKKRIGGVELAWEEAGQGVPLVLLHAFPLNRRMWDAQRQELAQSYRVITPDFRGHGESAVAKGTATMEALAEDLLALLDYLELERIVLGGLSMGGYAAFAFYRKHGDRVAALLLADTRAVADTEEGRTARLETAALAEREGVAAVAEGLLPRLLAPATLQKKPEVVGLVREMMLSTPAAGLAAAQRGMAARLDSSALLATIRCPTLILVGREDALSPPAEAEEMAKAIPDARLGVLSGAGHLSNLEQPEKFTQLVCGFLQRVRVD